MLRTALCRVINETYLSSDSDPTLNGRRAFCVSVFGVPGRFESHDAEDCAPDASLGVAAPVRILSRMRGPRRSPLIGLILSDLSRGGGGDLSGLSRRGGGDCGGRPAEAEALAPMEEEAAASVEAAAA